MAVGPAHHLPADGLARLVLGLCANYTDLGPKQPGQFSWLYDGTGAWSPEVWQLWIDADPLTIVQRKSDAFSPKQAVYLDGAQFDEFGANIGARKIYEVLRDRPAPVTFYEAQAITATGSQSVSAAGCAGCSSRGGETAHSFTAPPALAHPGEAMPETLGLFSVLTCDTVTVVGYPAIFSKLNFEDSDGRLAVVILLHPE